MLRRTRMLLLVLIGLVSGFKEPSAGTYKGVGTEAPAATLPDLDGVRHELADGAGGWTLLKFGTTWCPRCGQGVEELNKLAADLKKMKVRVVEVFLKEKPQVVRSDVKATPRAYQGVVLLDELGSTIPAYGISVIPRIFLVDSQGVVRLDQQFLEAPKLRQALIQAIQGR